MAVSMLCLALAVFVEARGEPELGQVAVAQVVINRSRIRSMPTCAVLLEKGQFTWRVRNYVKEVRTESGIQYVIDEKRLPVAKKGWENSMKAAQKALNQSSDMGKIEFFHASYVNPGWSSRYKLIIQIGNHLFYARKDDILSGKMA